MKITAKELLIMNHCTCTRSWPRAGNHEETCQLQVCTEIQKTFGRGNIDSVFTEYKNK